MLASEDRSAPVTSPALLLNRCGQRLSVRGASDIIRAIAADANLDEEHITAHVGRHTFATTLIRGGTGLVTVADMLGHARLDTVRTYTHPPPPTSPKPSPCRHKTADQHRWPDYTYLVATPCTAGGRGTP